MAVRIPTSSDSLSDEHPTPKELAVCRPLWNFWLREAVPVSVRRTLDVTTLTSAEKRCILLMAHSLHDRICTYSHLRQIIAAAIRDYSPLRDPYGEPFLSTFTFEAYLWWFLVTGEIFTPETREAAKGRPR